MEFKEIKDFIEANKEINDEVKAYLQGFKQFGVDEVSKFVGENEEGKKWFDSQKDKFFSKSLETWKTNNLEKIISDELAKRNPSETPEQKRIRELEDMFKRMESEKVRESLKNKALTIANEKKIPSQILDFFIGQDEESTVSNLDLFEEAMQAFVKLQVDERLKGSYTPPAGGQDPQGITKEQFQKMGYLERVKLQQDNPELYEKLTKN
ncbi:DUF4355 domain-containing protein [Mesobacillus foraminis]|uniref:Uncharacterized protein DUF4355 n=1 Tax=Mesobacillus foraminis TaxID=279826 RepID=A0A4R2BHI9_9BACI|nr:DUF4355 domain-containing protein [Mesobacillus foraminis]TCN25489.1 uncharacterized protein DUF4355 [Mesobacillus foraminis]